MQAEFRAHTPAAPETAAAARAGPQQPIRQHLAARAVLHTERQKAENFRRRTPADVEVASDQLAPVWTPTLVEFMTGKAPTPDELMSRKGTA